MKRLMRKFKKELANPEKYLYQHKDLYFPKRDDLNDKNRAKQMGKNIRETS